VRDGRPWSHGVHAGLYSVRAERSSKEASRRRILRVDHTSARIEQVGLQRLLIRRAHRACATLTTHVA